jgi:hypothetical protein
VDFERALAPQEIMIFCVGFLSCAKNIARFLFSEVKGKPRRRAAHMRDLLTVGDLPTLKNVSVRNSFEHLDERLDSILFSVVLPASFDPLSVTEKPPDPGTIVLKRFDPRNLIIQFHEHQLSLEECMADIRRVQQRIASGYEKLGASRFDIWAV